MQDSHYPRRNTATAPFDTAQKLRDAGYERCDLCGEWRHEDSLVDLQADEEIFICAGRGGLCATF